MQKFVYYLHKRGSLRLRNIRVGANFHAFVRHLLVNQQTEDDYWNIGKFQFRF